MYKLRPQILTRYVLIQNVGLTVLDPTTANNVTTDQNWFCHLMTLWPSTLAFDPKAQQQLAGLLLCQASWPWFNLLMRWSPDTWRGLCLHDHVQVHSRWRSLNTRQCPTGRLYLNMSQIGVPSSANEDTADKNWF